jgi:hypothetical protein
MPLVSLLLRYSTRSINLKIKIMAAFHKLCRKALLFGLRPADALVPDSAASPPLALQALIKESESRKRGRDAAATLYGNYYRSAYWAGYLLSSIAVALALLTIGLPALGGIFVGLEILVISLILLIYVIGSKKKWHQNWLEARRDAEFLRHQPLVTLLKSSVGEPHERHPLTLESARDLLLDQQGLWPWIQQQVSEQINYHHARAHDEHHLRHRVHRIAFGCFILTFIAVALHLVIHSNWLSIAAAFFPSLAAALTGVIAHSESERLEIDSKRMVSILQGLLTQLKTLPTSLSDRQALLSKSLDALLSDIDDWHVYAKEKTLTLA